MRNVSDESCEENPNTYFIFNNNFSEILAVWEKMCKSKVEPDMTQMAI